MKKFSLLSFFKPSNKNTMSKLVSGFTLIETLVVISVLIILISIIIPSFDKIGGAQALDTTVVSLISILNEAKSQAISSKDASNYGVRILNDKLISFKNYYGTENKETTISNLVTISTTTCSNCSDIVFNNISGSTSASGTITVTVLNDSTKYSKIKIYPTGLIERN